MSYLERRKLRKKAKTLLQQARTFLASREDIMSEADLEYLRTKISNTTTAMVTRENATLEVALQELEEALADLQPEQRFAGMRENFDVMVVAIAVAMAFRAYFYQPFKIPTGSMMPTLYGIHSEARPLSAATFLDGQPLKFAKWLLTGESFHKIQAKTVGELQITGDTNSKPGYMRLVVGGYNHYVPSDAIVAASPTGGVILSGTGLRQGQRVKAGDLLWSGVVISGDFVFVNRWKWNFCHPTRGEVMVFSTTGVNPGALQEGTHYIKRMTGLPNETLALAPPNLLVNGEVVTTPLRMAQIADKTLLPRAKVAYAGFNPAQGSTRYAPVNKTLLSSSDSVQLGPDEYYAMGDNSLNSYDSRYWGAVPERVLLGPAAMVYWPFTSPRFGRIR